MTSKTSLQADVVKKLQECLKEMGFEPETRVSEHEGLVHARREVNGKCIKVVAHISDRDVLPAESGGFVEARARAAQIAIRPTLAARSASRTAPPSDPKAGCE
jgi:hypothetical protein